MAQALVSISNATNGTASGLKQTEQATAGFLLIYALSYKDGGKNDNTTALADYATTEVQAPQPKSGVPAQDNPPGARSGVDEASAESFPACCVKG